MPRNEKILNGGKNWEDSNERKFSNSTLMLLLKPFWFDCLAVDKVRRPPSDYSNDTMEKSDSLDRKQQEQNLIKV